jgi:hypothetical protein
MSDETHFNLDRYTSAQSLPEEEEDDFISNIF